MGVGLCVCVGVGVVIVVVVCVFVCLYVCLCVYHVKHSNVNLTSVVMMVDVLRSYIHCDVDITSVLIWLKRGLGDDI